MTDDKKELADPPAGFRIEAIEASLSVRRGAVLRATTR